jgi:hypothetical protein
MSIKVLGRYKAGAPELIEKASQETIQRGAPVFFHDDFLGYKLNKYIANENTVAPWHTVVTNSPTSAPLLVANAAGGVAQMALAVTNEAERSVLYMGDQLPFDITMGLIWECRAAFHVLTDVAAGIIVLGLASADNATADTIASNLWFRLEGASANILWESDDNVTNDDDNDTGVDAVADEYHIFRIDCTIPTTPLFYIDGNLVGTASAAFVAAGTGAVQPYFAVEKASGASVGTLYVDDVKVWQNRA